MRFLVDAQLPPRLARRLRDLGHDAVHTIDLPQGNRTPDASICSMCVRDERVLISKDADFVNTFVLARQPPKLLLISTGNIRNAALELLVVSHLPAIIAALAQNDFVELTQSQLIIRG